jgi:hypothetical protein
MARVRRLPRRKRNSPQPEHLGTPIIPDAQRWHDISVMLRPINERCAEVILCAAGKCKVIGRVCDS